MTTALTIGDIIITVIFIFSVVLFIGYIYYLMSLHQSMINTDRVSYIVPSLNDLDNIVSVSKVNQSKKQQKRPI